MRRRNFLASSTAALVALATSPLSRPAAAAGEKVVAEADRLMLEIRKYHFASASKQEAYASFLGAAAIPAYNRAGVEPVGAFKLLAKDNPELKLAEDSTDLWLVVPYKSFASVITLESRLAADAAFQAAGHDILMAAKADPAFVRYESSLLYAFDCFPQVAPPPKSDARVLELRTYENPSQERALNKMAMFGAGEIPVFARAGMPGVFFGEAVAGPNLPQLTYMVAHPDADSIKKDWSAFGSDADWKKLKGEAQYKDNVSKIQRYFLRPVAGSQI